MRGNAGMEHLSSPSAAEIFVKLTRFHEIISINKTDKPKICYLHRCAMGKDPPNLLINAAHCLHETRTEVSYFITAYSTTEKDFLKQLTRYFFHKTPKPGILRLASIWHQVKFANFSSSKFKKHSSNQVQNFNQPSRTMSGVSWEF